MTSGSSLSSSTKEEVRTMKLEMRCDTRQHPYDPPPHNPEPGTRGVYRDGDQTHVGDPHGRITPASDNFPMPEKHTPEGT
jgi:hypothetical protein